MTTQAEGKLEEAEFFLNKLVQSSGDEFRYYLSAFLGAARAVTLALQKEHSGDEDFEEYYSNMREMLSDTSLCPVLLELRNHTQHRGVIEPADSEEIHIPGREIATVREEPYHENNLPEYKESENIIEHRLELPGDVINEVSDEKVSSFREEYETVSIEDMCREYYNYIWFTVKNSPT